MVNFSPTRVPTAAAMRTVGILESLGGFQDLGGMALDLHLRPNMGNAAVRPDQKSRPKNPSEAFAVHGLFAPAPVTLAHLMGLVVKQPDAQVVLFLQRVLCLY